MKAVVIADIYEVDKNGNDKPVGLMYLKFLVEKCEWFRHSEIIEHVINNAIDCMSGDEGKEQEKTKEVNQKKENKPKKEKSVPDTHTSTVINLS